MSVAEALQSPLAVLKKTTYKKGRRKVQLKRGVRVARSHEPSGFEYRDENLCLRGRGATGHQGTSYLITMYICKICRSNYHGGHQKSRPFSLHFGLGRNAYLEVLDDDTKIEVDYIVLSNILTTAPAGVCEVPRVLKHSENPGNSSTLLYWAITCILDHLSQVMQNLFGGSEALDELPPVTVETLVRALK
jgi:hypothetical protein